MAKKKPGKTAAQPKKKHKQNKPQGHFCYVCGEHKANEKFSGRGYANHICKQCNALPAAKRNEMIAIRKIGNMTFRYLSKAEINWLLEKMSDSRPDVQSAAREAYSIMFPNHTLQMDKSVNLKTPVLFSEMKEEHKTEALERLEGLIDDFFLGADYIPRDEDRDEILSVLCEEMSETLNQWEPEPYDPSAGHDPRFDFGPEIGFNERIVLMKEILDANAEEYDPYAEPEEPEPEPQKELIVDDGLIAVYDDIVSRFIADMKADGVELPTFMDTLLVVETERLRLRRFHNTDLAPLWAIMKKPEVMYAWESGFSRGETRKWLHRQYTRYHKDGYGYFAVILKDTGVLIGQAGLMKSDMNGETVGEIGYIFDDTVWGQGYAFEAACACVDLAFGRYGFDRLYATVRPENTTSIRLAEKLGMRKTGEVVKTYQGKEMPHDIFVLDKT